MLYWAIALICCKITKKYREIRFSNQEYRIKRLKRGAFKRLL